MAGMLKWFTVADKGADLLMRWAAVLIALSSGYTWAAKHATIFGIRNWPDAILIGVFLGLISLLVLSAVLVAIRYFRPLAASEAPTPVTDGDDLAKIRASYPLLVERIGQTEQETLARLGNLSDAVASALERVGAIEADIGTAKDGEQNLRAAIQGFTGASMNLTTELNDRQVELIQAAKAELGKKIERLGELHNEARDYVRTQVASLYAALSAVYHRERLNELAAEIERVAATLCKPTTEQAKYDTEAWEQWEVLEGEWRSILSDWVNLAGCYNPDTFGAVNYTPEKLYRGGWSVSDAQFPSSDAVYAYKTFRIRLKNWENIREAVEKKVHTIAFNGGTANSVPVVLGEQVLNALSPWRPSDDVAKSF